jgi:hypothetical protein
MNRHVALAAALLYLSMKTTTTALLQFSKR